MTAEHRSGARGSGEAAEASGNPGRGEQAAATRMIPKMFPPPLQVGSYVRIHRGAYVNRVGTVVEFGRTGILVDLGSEKAWVGKMDVKVGVPAAAAAAEVSESPAKGEAKGKAKGEAKGEAKGKAKGEAKGKAKGKALDVSSDAAGAVSESPAKRKAGEALSAGAAASMPTDPTDSFNAQFKPADNRFKSICATCEDVMRWNSKCQSCGGESVTFAKRNKRLKQGYKLCRCGFTGHHKTPAWTEHVESCTA